MMQAVRSSMEDADVCLLVADLRDDFAELDAMFSSLKLKATSILVLNKCDLVKKDRVAQAEEFFSDKPYCKKVISVSASGKQRLNDLLELVVSLLPEGEPFYDQEELTDLPTKFFAGELVREKIFELFNEEIPYQTTVMVSKFEEKENLTRISAVIVVQRESQKAIILGTGGSMIKKLGTVSRISLETFLDRKVYLELFVKVRNNWRNNELYLNEYGYN